MSEFVTAHGGRDASGFIQLQAEDGKPLRVNVVEGYSDVVTETVSNGNCSDGKGFARCPALGNGCAGAGAVDENGNVRMISSNGKILAKHCMIYNKTFLIPKNYLKRP